MTLPVGPVPRILRRVALLNATAFLADTLAYAVGLGPMETPRWPVTVH